MKTFWTFAPCPTRRLRQTRTQLFLIWRTGGQWCAFTHYPKRALDVITEYVSGLTSSRFPTVPETRTLLPSSFPDLCFLWVKSWGVFIKSNDLPSRLALLYWLFDLTDVTTIRNCWYCHFNIYQKLFGIYTLPKLNLLINVSWEWGSRSYKSHWHSRNSFSDHIFFVVHHE